MVVVGCAMLAACASGSQSGGPETIGEGNSGIRPGGSYKVGKPYQISGVWYYPAEDYSYSETGVASWYGPDFHGKFTANGEIFDQNELTAAHRTLPMPSFVRVTNLDSGRSLVVRVNDRGPFAHGRILDLSRRAAQLLGIAERGMAKVHVEILADESRALALRLRSMSPDEPRVVAAPRESVVKSEPLPPVRQEVRQEIRQELPKENARPRPVVEAGPVDQQVKMVPARQTQLYVQAGAYAQYDNASRVHAVLGAVGRAAISQVQTKSGTIFRVRLGPIASVGDADALLEKVIGSGYPDAKLVVD